MNMHDSIVIFFQPWKSTRRSSNATQRVVPNSDYADIRHQRPQINASNQAGCHKMFNEGDTNLYTRQSSAQ